MNSFKYILTYPAGTFFVYVKTKKTDPLCINTELRSVNLVITEFNLWAFEVTLKRKKAGLLPLKEKIRPDYSNQCHNLNRVKFDNFLKPCYKCIITD